MNRWRALETDDEGKLLLPYLRGSTPTTVRLDQGSLEDPFWQADFAAAKFVSHPGGVNKLSIAVRETAEIEGSVFLDQGDGAPRELPGIPMVLLNERGEVIAETISEFDGYFVFNMILPGRYRIEIPDAVFARLGVSHMEPVPVNVGEGVHYVDEMVLIPEG